MSSDETKYLQGSPGGKKGETFENGAVHLFASNAPLRRCPFRPRRPRADRR